MRYAWENGLYASRWLPDVAFGYGYPFFVYREPTPLYASLLPHLMGMSLPAAENLFYAVTILACGWFMYLWVRDIFGKRAGLVAGVAYMAAPYVLVDALVRGNSPESLALPLLPLLLWLGRRWMVNGRPTPFLLGTLSLAFFSLSHNISLLLFTPFLLLYLLLLGWHHQLAWRVTAVRLILFVGLGLGMTIFYAGGALLELDSVTLEQSTTTRNNDFRFNFVTWDEILAPVAPEDPNLLNPELDFRLGWMPTLLALLGVAVFGWRRIRQKRFEDEKELHIWLMVGMTAVYLFMSLPISQPLWEGLPLIDFVQFPWRFVGRAALPVAFLAGVPFAGRNGRAITILAGLAVGLLLLEAVPNLYPNICPEEPFPTINTVHNYEHVTGLVGVDPEGSYFPRTVQKRPSASPLEAAYLQGEFPQRFLLPEGVTFTVLEAVPLGGVVEVAADAPFTAVYQTFDFAGWQAFVDGERVPITPSEPEGLITFEVPSGRHTLKVGWRSTPLRTTLLGLSILSLAGTAVVSLILFTEASSQTPKQVESIQERNGRSQLLSLVLLGIALGMIGLKWGLFDRVETPLRRPNALNIPMKMDIRGGELRVMDMRVDGLETPSDGVIEVDLAITAVDSPTRRYQTNVWLEDEAGQLWSDKNTFRPRKYEDAPPTLAWQPGQWAWESWEVEPLSGTPPGKYNLVMTLFDLETLQPVTLHNGAGQPVGSEVVLTELFVGKPEGEVVAQPQFLLQTAVPNTGLQLLGYNQDRTEAQPGEAMTVSVFVERVEETAVAPLTLSLLDAAGDLQKNWELALLDANLWQVGEWYRGQRVLTVPGGLASGQYQFVLNGAPLGSLSVTAPERIFETPPFDTAVEQTFRDGTAVATLLGYSITEDDPLSVQLVWQAESEVEISYRVFIHLLDENGEIITQSDGEPAAWSRPTTSWAEGEIIIDTHTLAVDATQLSDPPLLRVGIYNPDDGVRLSVGVSDFVLLP